MDLFWNEFKYLGCQEEDARIYPGGLDVFPKGLGRAFDELLNAVISVKNQGAVRLLPFMYEESRCSAALPMKPEHFGEI